MVFITTITACDKNNAPNPQTQLVGKWKLSSYYSSTGGPGVWKDAQQAQQTLLEFKSDGTLGGNDFATAYSTYAVKDSATIVLTKKNSKETQNYKFAIENRFLTLSPAGPTYCIEGCATRYARQ